MAVDKLVDSTILNACCTAEANAIRAKTGDSTQIAYDFANSKGFADAIAAIPSGGSTPRLPAEYQEVEYIQTDGTAYIDTGYKPTGMTMLRTKAYRPPSGAYYWDLFGLQESANNCWCYIYGTQGYNISIAGTRSAGVYAVPLNYPTATYGEWFELVVRWDSSNSALAAADVTHIYTGSGTGQVATTFTNSAPFLARNKDGTIQRQAGTRGEYLELYDGANFDQIRNLISCYRKSSGVIGMYDLAQSGAGNDSTDNNFFINAASSGSFTKGADVTA